MLSTVLSVRALKLDQACDSSIRVNVRSFVGTIRKVVFSFPVRMILERSFHFKGGVWTCRDAAWRLRMGLTQ